VAIVERLLNRMQGVALVKAFLARATLCHSIEVRRRPPFRQTPATQHQDLARGRPVI
jgi:hypothetical protein